MMRAEQKRRRCQKGLVAAGLALAGLLSGRGMAFPPAAAAAEDQIVAVRDVRVFDGERLVPRTTVVFRGKKILSVAAKEPLPRDAETIEGDGKTLLPGLIDSHVHVWNKDGLRQYLAFGVTAVVDMFTSAQFLSEIKKSQAEDRAADLAWLVSPGTLATAPGGHGTQYGLPIPTLTRPDEAESFVEARLKEGADFIKIIVDDGSAFGLSMPTLSKEVLAALIQSAHRRGKIAVVHAATLQNCLDALDAGADALAHLYFNDASSPEFGDLAAKRKAFVIPTLSVLQTIAGITEAEILIEDSRLGVYLKTFDIQNLKRSFPFASSKSNYGTAERALRQLREAGVPILAGTDAPNPRTAYGASLHRELWLLVQAGLSPTEALRAATSVPAEKFKIPGRGRIRPGMNADLLLVAGDPTGDITATRDIVAVWKDGRRVDRDAYLEEAKRDRDTAALGAPAPAPEYGDISLISDFESDKIEAKFGAGWIISTDAMRGGKSTAEMKLVAGGAQTNGRSLLIAGKIEADSVQSWAGALFSPGKTMMAPVDLSSKKAISFWAKGDGRRYAVMVFAQRLGFMPAFQFFTPGPEWKEFTFPFEGFRLKGDDIMGIFIGASGENGEFVLQIDDVKLK